MSRVRVARADQIGEGRLLRVDADGRPLLVSRSGGRLGAIDAICSHAGGRLEDGDLADGCVVCPVHAAVFDLTTGKVSADTGWATDLQSHRVISEGGELYVDLPDEAAAAGGVGDARPAAGEMRAACAYAGAPRGLDYNPMTPEQRECPFDLYRRARTEMPVFYSERFDLWVVTRYDDIVRILNDPATFSSAQSLALDAGVTPEVQAVLDTGYPATPTMVTADPPVHTRFRELVGKAFTSRRVVLMELRMREIAHELIGSLRAGRPRRPRTAVCVPVADGSDRGNPGACRCPPTWTNSSDWSDEMSARFGPLPLERQVECARAEVEFQHYFAARLEERRRHPQTDLLTDLINARILREAPLDLPELLSILKQLLIGGNETSTNLIRQHDAVAAERSRSARGRDQGPRARGERGGRGVAAGLPGAGAVSIGDARGGGWRRQNSGGRAPGADLRLGQSRRAALP